MRIRFIKNWKGYRIGQVVRMASQKAYDLVSRGLAIRDKSMTDADMKTSKSHNLRSK